jgi:hypothetical protein
LRTVRRGARCLCGGGGAPSPRPGCASPLPSKPAGSRATAEAARWASHGYLPQEAGPLFADGITADRQAELEQHAADQVGGHEALAALRIAELHAAGVLGPDDVVTVQDPFNPGQKIIVPREDLE